MDALQILEIIEKYKSNELTYEETTLLLVTIGLKPDEILPLIKS